MAAAAVVSAADDAPASDASFVVKDVSIAAACAERREGGAIVSNCPLQAPEGYNGVEKSR
jgi:hypothetical protein